ncbi:MAG: Holliday junction branch migration protein RuvA [Candidatus Lutibacillus vidarii]|nr:Holliday junction branch migration protein RuvA [Candidatus Lutibacillus vidarii]HON74492.1 Holliday junction branch migration protein RuvA [Dermatophilaceae bacterium]HRB98867.1 Holliday junction branch migration protein RuvA [Dermatophilaceae bacterium]
MIASLTGLVGHAGLDSVVVEVGGLGLRAHTTPATAAGVRPGQQVRLATSLVVREDALTLFGFATDAERDLFEVVQTVSGVGPRLALAMLAVHTPDALRAAIAGGDLIALTKVPGIGRKGAERIVLELRDKVGTTQPVAAGASLTVGAPDWRGQVSQALVGLGWSAKQADDAVERVAPLADDGAGVAALLRAALQVLGR